MRQDDPFRIEPLLMTEKYEDIRIEEDEDDSY
jgi:hypothetical protein